MGDLCEKACSPHSALGFSVRGNPPPRPCGGAAPAGRGGRAVLRPHRTVHRQSEHAALRYPRRHLPGNGGLDRGRNRHRPGRGRQHLGIRSGGAFPRGRGSGQRTDRAGSLSVRGRDGGGNRAAARHGNRFAGSAGGRSGCASALRAVGGDSDTERIQRGAARGRALRGYSGCIRDSV